jgi:ketosteroid isomerase-like protein
MAAMYAEDAYLLSPGHEIVKGRSQIRDFWAGVVQKLGDAKLTTVDVQKLGPAAAREIGTFSFKTKGQTPQPVAGKYAIESPTTTARANSGTSNAANVFAQN